MQVLIPQKIAPPYQRAHLTPRSRLCQEILDNLDRKVSLISASAGYGKTSLAAELSRRSELLSCWYQLDSKDVNLDTFYDYLCEALNDQLVDFKAKLPAPSPDESPWGLAGLVSSTLYKHVSEPLLIFLDNFHEVDNCEPINRFVDALITYLPPTCHLVIISRTSTDLNLARLVIQQDLNLITNQDLQLSLEEATDIAATFAMNAAVNIKHLHQKVEGWVAGFTLLASQHARQSPKLSPDKLVRDYLKTEFFDALNPLEQRFALYSAAIAPFTARDLESEFGPELGRLVERFVNHYQMLYQAEQAREEQPLFSYMPLVRSFLADRLEHTDPEAWQDLNVRIGEQRWAEGRFEALEYLAKAKRYDLIVKKLASLESHLIETGDWRKLGSWLQGIPEADLQARGELLTILAETEVMSQPAEALRHYQLALAQRLDVQTRAVALVGRLRATFKLQRFQQVVLTSEVTLAELAESSCNGTPCSKELAQATSLLASSHLMLGNYADAKRTFKHVMQLARETEDDYINSLAARGLAAHAGHVGDVHQAVKLDKPVLSYWETRGNRFEVASVLNNLAASNYYLGELEAALEYGSRAFNMREELEATGRFALLCCTLGDIYQANRQPTEAQKHYDLALRHSQTKQFAHAYALQGAALLAIEQKNLAEADEQASQALKLAKENGLPLLEGLAQLRLGQAKPNQERSLAAEHFDLAIDIFEAMGAKRELGLAHFLKSHKSANQQTAAEHRQKASCIQAELNYPLHRLTQEAKLKPSKAYQTKLRLYTLGQLEFQLNSSVIPVKTWNGRKPRDIVLFLASRLHGASRDQIIDALWQEGSNLEQQFSIALSRARRALGEKRVIVRKDQLYIFADDIHIEEDAHLIETTSPDAPTKAIKAALERYKGDYLPGYYDNWVEARREHLRTKALLLLGIVLEQLDGQSLQEAPDLAATALSIDSCHEESHRQLIRYYLNHSGPAAAQRQYGQYLEALRDMNIEPNPAITALLDA